MEKSEQIQSYGWILGIDVSKESIDACLIRASDGQLFESKFHNNLSGFRHLKGWCKQMHCECGSLSVCVGCLHGERANTEQMKVIFNPAKIHQIKVCVLFVQ